MTYKQQLASPYPMRSALTGSKNAAGELTSVTWAVAEPVNGSNGLQHIVHSYFFYNTPHDGWRLSPEPLDDGRAVSFERAVALLRPFDPLKQEADNNPLCIVDDMRALAGLIDDENEIELPEALADKLRLIQHYSRRVGQLHCTTDANGNVVSQGKAGLPVGKVHVPVAALVATDAGLAGLGPLTERDDLADGHKMGDWLYVVGQDKLIKNTNEDIPNGVYPHWLRFEGVQVVSKEHSLSACAIIKYEEIRFMGDRQINLKLNECEIRDYFDELDNMSLPNRIVAARKDSATYAPKLFALRAFDQLRAEQKAALEAEADKIRALPAPGLPDPTVPRLKAKAPQQG